MTDKPVVTSEVMDFDGTIRRYGRRGLAAVIPPATVVLTEQERADLARMPEADRRVIAAFRQAMADYDTPSHPDGKCPSAPCPCSLAADAIEARVRELLDDPDAVPCIDCWVPLPLNVTSYAVDGAVVCGPCGVRRYGDRASEHLPALRRGTPS